MRNIFSSIVINFLLFSLLAPHVIPAYAQTLVTPTVYCLGACPTTGLMPTTQITPVTQTTIQPSITQTAAPSNIMTTLVTTQATTVVPCEQTVSTAKWHSRHKQHHGWMRNFFAFFFELIKQLLAQLGMQPTQPVPAPAPTPGGNPIPTIQQPCQPAPSRALTMVPTMQPTTMPTNRPSLTQVPTIAATAIPQTQGKFVSVGFYPGWFQSNTPPNQIDYTPWTHIMHFGFYPTTSGTVGNGDMDPSYPAPAISAAHGAGKKILVTIGGAGSGSGFVSSTNASTLSTFVTNIVAHMKKYGYDGVDIDWEENVSETPFVNLLTQLRTALNKESPKPILSVDVDKDLVPPSMTAKIASQVDIINVMSYWDNGTAMMKAYTDAGIPANKLTFGIGFSPELYDQTADKVQTKVNYAKQQGFLGVMSWSMENAKNTDPRLQPLRDYITGK